MGGDFISQSTLIHVFNFSVILGLLIPLLSLFAGWIGGAFGGSADIDVDVDVDVDLGAAKGTGSGSGSLLPFNLMCFCLFLIVFGAAGHMTREFMTTLPVTVALLGGCFAVAVFFYWALYKVLIKRLKENDASAISFHDLRGRSGEVTLSIRGDSMGTISLRDSNGAAISFRAKIDPCLKNKMPPVIPAGEQVVITEVDAGNKLCYVSMYISRINQMGGKDV